MRRMPWPEGFPRVLPDDWTHRPVETLAIKYDTVANHGWYRNLDRTLEQLESEAPEGAIVADYSGGTGIFVDRFFRRNPERDVSFVIVDASPKFLRLALEKLGSDPRVAFRWIRYLKEAGRLEYIDEVLGEGIVLDALVSTNAIHLYYDLGGTLRGWWRAMRPGAAALVQSGNIRNPEAPRGSWIIDETVEAVNRIARRRIREDDRWRQYRAALEDRMRRKAYARFRRKVFLPVRPLAHYLDALVEAGFRIEGVETRPISAKVIDWFEFLAAYHEAVLGWIGGVEKIDGRPPPEDAVRDRLVLIKESLEELFSGADSFEACWTYVTARKPAA